MAHLVVGAEGQGRLVNVDRRELGTERAHDVEVDDQLLEAGDEATLQPAARMHHPIGAGEKRGLHGVHALVRGLRVGDRARRQRAAAGAPRQVVAPRQLTGGKQAEVRLGAAERGRAVLEVGRREERAEHGGTARRDRLHQRDAGQPLGELLRERRHRAGRRHRAHQQERHDQYGLAGAGVDDQRVQHALVVDQRRVDVDVRIDAGLRIEAVPEHDARHRQRILGGGDADRMAAGGLVRQREDAAHRVEVARVERDVVGLDGPAARQIEIVEVLRQPAEVIEIGQHGLAALQTAADERRPLHRDEDHGVAADANVPRPVARMQRELARRLGHHLKHPFRVEEDDVALDPLPGFGEHAERLRVVEADAELRHQPHPAALDRGEAVGRDRLEAWVAVGEHPPAA